jgi:hypothetical protein
MRRPTLNLCDPAVVQDIERPGISSAIDANEFPPKLTSWSL